MQDLTPVRPGCLSSPYDEGGCGNARPDPIPRTAGSELCRQGYWYLPDLGPIQNCQQILHFTLKAVENLAAPSYKVLKTKDILNLAPKLLVRLQA